MNLQNTKIGTRLILGFGLLISLMMTIAGVATWSGIESRTAAGDSRRLGEILLQTKDMLLDVRQTRALTYFYVAMRDEQTLKDIDQAKENYADEFKKTEALVHSPEGKEALGKFNISVQNFEVAAKSMRDLVAKHISLEAPESIKIISDVKAAVNQYNATGSDFLNDQTKRYRKFQHEIEAAADQSVRWSWILGGSGLLMGLIFAYLISRSITKPVSAMTKAMGIIAGGDLSVQVPALGNKDEVGEMAKAVKIFQDNALKLKATEAEEARTRQAAEQERQTNEAARGEILKQQVRSQLWPEVSIICPRAI